MVSTAPQAFTRVMALVSTFLHCVWIRIRRYLDDWLIQTSSRSLVLQALDTVLWLCQDLGIVVNWEKSNLVPSQHLVYLGVILDSLSFRASPSQPRAEKLLSVGEEFLSSIAQPVSSWCMLLGVLSSLTPLIPGGRSSCFSIVVGSSRRLDLSQAGRLLSTGSGVVAGAVTSGVGHLSCAEIPRPLLLVRCVRRGLGSSLGGRGRFGPLVSRGGRSLYQCQGALDDGEGSASVLSSDLWIHGGRLHGQFDDSGISAQARRNSLSRPQLHCSTDSPLGGVSPDCSSSPIYHGKNNVLVDSVSRPNQVQGSEWTLKWKVFQDLHKKWPVMIDLFATSFNHRCSLYFSPFHNPRALETDALLQNWDGRHVYTSPPWSLIPLVLKKLHSSSRVLITLVAPFWPQQPWFTDLLHLMVDGPVQLPLSPDLLRQPHFHCRRLGIHRLSLHA